MNRKHALFNKKGNGGKRDFNLHCGPPLHRGPAFFIVNGKEEQLDFNLHCGHAVFNVKGKGGRQSSFCIVGVSFQRKCDRGIKRLQLSVDRKEEYLDFKRVKRVFSEFST